MPCGISGFVGLSDKELLRRMVEIQSHRGPDSEGYYIDSNVGLGTDRLSIIDLAKGDQPIHNEDGSVWITYNGEVYNYIELKQELEMKGHRFYTQSDTETIVHSYEEWGEECLTKLRGMFAFAIWDSKRKRLFAARDRFGKKPFYYAQVDGKLVFSSELKGILQYEALPHEMSREGLDLFFTYFYIPSPYTIFEGMYKLPPGHYLVYEGGKLRVRKYWDMRFNPVEQSEREAIDKLHALISESVRIRLRSDVPLGAFLSGGIDSSVVTAMMCRMSEAGGRVKTVTVGFDEEDEHVRFGRIVAEYLGTEHTERIVDAHALMMLPELIWHFDEPFADSSFIPTYYVSKEMRREVKVALTGDGGDEMFMGYPFLKDPSVYGLYKMLPRSARSVALKLILKVPGKTGMKKMANYALERDYGSHDFLGRYMMRMVVFTPSTLPSLYSDAKVTPKRDTLGFLRSSLLESGSNDALDAVTYATIKGYLSEMILTKVDRMSMAVSLEPRCPLLDQQIAEYVGTLPSRLKFNGKTTKYIFKKMALAKGLLPKNVVTRRKVGFGPPVDKWFGEEWLELSDQIVERATKIGLFDRQYLNNLIRNRYVNSAKIFGLTVFTLWYSQYVESGMDRPVPMRKLL